MDPKTLDFTCTKLDTLFNYAIWLNCPSRNAIRFIFLITDYCILSYSILDILKWLGGYSLNAQYIMWGEAHQP